jgi:hypothetical protein
MPGKLEGAAPCEATNPTPARLSQPKALPSRTGRFDTVYLRAAQAYMLISMPTGTSTIFGVFQVIRGLPSSLAHSRRGESRARSDVTQVPTSQMSQRHFRADGDQSRPQFFLFGLSH